MFSNEGNIKESIMNADLIIGVVLIPGASAPKIMKSTHKST